MSLRHRVAALNNPFNDPIVQAQIAHIEELAPRSARYREVDAKMHASLVEKLRAEGIDQLYSHQAAAFDAASEGKDLIVVTGTNSGKTLCYNLPALQMCLTEPVGRALYLFPTKSLAHDQLQRLEDLVPESRVRVATYDGDTPKTHRSAVRKLANIVLTNPDMVHAAILPANDLWAKFLKSLRLIVIDEMHVYRGVFGSHVGNVLRRLLRLCEWHRVRPQIIACSATIGNPRELMLELTGRQATLIDVDGSPSGKRTFVFWNPTEISPGVRLSSNVATSEIVATLAEAGQRTLAFSRARITAELVLRYTRQRLQPAMARAIESYRAGYTPKERRNIETALFRGDLLALSATNAMELGVDVGTLDAVVINGYPGTTSSFWQQAGRAGRGSRDGLAIYVANNDPLEQFLIRQPKMLLEARNENVTANPQNRAILRQHLLCAAQERPISPSELERFGMRALEIAERLDTTGELSFRAGLFFYPAIESPAFEVNIRNAGGDQVTLYNQDEPMGTMERWRAMTSAHEGAVYLHRGATYTVAKLDLDAGRADVVPSEPDYFTRAIVQSLLQSGEHFESTELGPCVAGVAPVRVTDTVEGYHKRSLDGDIVIGTEFLELPPVSYDSMCVRFDLPELEDNVDMTLQAAAFHGLEHCLLSVAPLFAGCDRNDLGSGWYLFVPETKRPGVYIFDRIPGGIGLSEMLFRVLPEWLLSARNLLATCPCEDGCPACLYSSRCELFNDTLNKHATLNLLQRML